MYVEIKMVKNFFVLDVKGMLIFKLSQFKEQGYKEGILEYDLIEGIELELYVSFSDKYYFY